jgi:hypothetical protein
VFCQSTRPDLREENPDMSARDLTAKLQEMWDGMSEEERCEYN